MTPRKARREVEFMEWDGSEESTHQILDWLADNGQKAYRVYGTDLSLEHLKVPNKWGNYNAYRGDVVIKHPNGEFGVSKSKEFHMRYREVASAPVEDAVSRLEDDGEVEPLLGLFDFYNISDGMHREIVKMFSDLAYRMSREIPKGGKRTTALVKLSIAMDDVVAAYVLR